MTVFPVVCALALLLSTIVNSSLCKCQGPLRLKMSARSIRLALIMHRVAVGSTIVGCFTMAWVAQNSNPVVLTLIFGFIAVKVLDRKHWRHLYLHTKGPFNVLSTHKILMDFYRSPKNEGTSLILRRVSAGRGIAVQVRGRQWLVVTFKDRLVFTSLMAAYHRQGSTALALRLVKRNGTLTIKVLEEKQ